MRQGNQTGRVLPVCYVAFAELKIEKLKTLGEVQWTDHQSCGSKRVARTLKVVPFDTIQFPNVLSLDKVHPVKV